MQQTQNITIIKKENKAKIKDLVRVLGYKNNQLVGYGIVVGLNGTGDTKSSLNKQILENLFSKWNLQVSIRDFDTKNIASVMVIAEIPPFAKKGDRISCYVASIGDAKSLQDGVLLQTPLFGANGQIYALAQGKIHTTIEEKSLFQRTGTGYIPNGVIIERDLQELELGNQFRLQLLEFDFDVLTILHHTIKQNFPNINLQIDGGSIVIINERDEVLSLISQILNLEVSIPQKAKIYVYPKQQTIVLMGDISLSPFTVIRTPKPKQYDKIQREAYQGIYIYTPGLDQVRSVVQVKATNIEELVNELNQNAFTFSEIVFILQSLVDSRTIKADFILQ
ncbi:MAG: flagellar basal body P-ring protein FlgI [Leptospiraceae bacterium]|nr:flagellar basal body P-ring protein FlgI [Leptospiraceae bacterium]